MSQHRMFELAVPISAADHILGNPHATATVVEFGDFECPNCKQAAPAVKLLLERFSGRIAFVYRHFPLQEVHPHALHAALAAEAAAAQGKFWQMHDLLYENQDALQPDDVIVYAAAAGVDRREVADDLSAHTQRARVQRDVDSGTRSGVKGTPTFFVNGRRFEGDWRDPASLMDALQDGAWGHTYTAH